MRFSFPKNKRLVNDKQFKAVLAGNLRVQSAAGGLTLYMAKNDCAYPRLGISVKKSCGNAVIRNRLKRLLREAFRQSQDQIPAGFDYLLMISPKRSKKVKRSSKNSKLKTQNSKLMKPTFQQVKGSFLALVTDVVSRTKNSKLKTNGSEA